MSPASPRVPWEIDLELHRWQRDALGAWEGAANRGVIEAATGTGKTIIALAAIARLHEEFGDQLRVAIIVPTVVLARQWRKQLQDQLHISPRWIGEQHSAAITDYWSQPILLTVANTAREYLYTELEAWKSQGLRVFLIADECHRLGSDFNSLALEGEYAFSLGLSATPERDDAGHIHYVYPALGPPVFRYPLGEALDGGVLAELLSVNLYVDFDPDELEQWERLSGDIGVAFAMLAGLHPRLLKTPGELMMAKIARLAKHADPLAAKILKLVSERRLLVSEARQRGNCLIDVMAWLRDSRLRALVFHETKAAAEASCEVLLGWGVPAALEHSGLPRDTRDRAFSRFSDGRVSVLVAVRALDEGVDVPEASVAVVAAGSRSRRQRIQRLGRILRRVDGKNAIAVTILVRGTPEESAVGGADAGLVGQHRVRHHRWPTQSAIEELVGGSPSTYAPAKPHTQPTEIADDLTRTELGIRPERPVARTPVARRESPFSVNGWHSAEDVRHWLAVDADWFDQTRASVRRIFAGGLDPARAADGSLVHGTEVEAILRLHYEAGGTHAPQGSARQDDPADGVRRVISSRKSWPVEG